MKINFIKANWPAPSCIVAGTTTRQGGYSQAPFTSFNLASHVGDDSDIVIRNRSLLESELDLPQPPRWLNQTHSNNVINVSSFETKFSDKQLLTDNCADAAISFKANTICAVLTADCVPILVTDSIGSCIAAIHAGWRGLRDGIIEKTISKLNFDSNSCSQKLLVWIGPAISRTAFEVDDQVRDEFVSLDSAAKVAYTPSRPGHWLMDLVSLVKLRLNNCGIPDNAIFGGDYCSYSDSDLFYSYRRDKSTGRMASLIYFRHS